MNQTETLIVILLTLITYFLYQITKQLSYLTGKRIKFRLPKIPTFHKKETKKEKLVN